MPLCIVVSFNKVRRKSDVPKEIIIVPPETNVNVVIPLPRIIEVQEAKKNSFRVNKDNDIAVISSVNDIGIESEINNQTILSNSGKKCRK